MSGQPDATTRWDRRLRSRLLAAYIIPTLTLFTIFAWVSYRETQASLDRSLGERLVAIAQAISAQIRPETLGFIAPGDDNTRTARRLKKRLRTLVQTTGVSRVFVIDRQLRSLADSDSSVHIGDRHYQAESDRSELADVFAGNGRSSVLFVGARGQRFKTGYAPIAEGQRVIAAIGVMGSARYFRDLEKHTHYVIISGLFVAFSMFIVTMLVANRITRPINKLADAAVDIGRGQLENPIVVRGRDEVGFLAKTMDQMRQELLQRDQQMQMMLSGIAHEVRNPLGGIALFTGLLRDELAANPEQLDMVQRIQRELDYLTRVVTDFLEFARHQPISETSFDIAELVSEVLELIGTEAHEKGVALHHHVSSAELAGDRERIKGTVLNVLRNAIQATDPDGRIDIRYHSTDEENGLIIEDNGCGIPKEALERIREPFFTTRQRGTGLGLALAELVMKAHAGRLEIDSVESKGTTVRLWFPRSQPS